MMIFVCSLFKAPRPPGLVSNYLQRLQFLFILTNINTIGKILYITIKEMYK